MTTDSIVALAVLAVAAVVLVLDRFQPVLVLAGAVGALLFGGVIESDTALSGLSSPAPATIAALYVIAGAATATGTFASIVDRLLDRGGSLFALTATTAGLSSVVPNTPLVAMFAPRVVRWSQRNGASASRYLLPLSFASILGGVVTLIGTSTNLVVSDLLEQSGAEPLEVLEITVVGLPVAVIGVLVLSTLGARLLPERSTGSRDLTRRAREFQMAARVDPDGPLAGSSIAESGLRSLDGVFLAMIERSTASGRVISLPASPDTMLEAGDVCCFVGDAGDVIDLHDVDGLVSVERKHLLDAEGPGTLVYEAVVAPGSRLVGASLRSADFRSRYGGAVIAIHRSDAPLGGQLGRIALRGGDVLLVLGDERFGQQWRSDADFSLVAAHDGPSLPRRQRSWLVVAAFVGLVLAAATGLVPLFEAAAAAAVVVVAGGALTMREAWRAINLDVVLTMAVAISLGGAIAASGLAADIASVVERVSSLGLGDVGIVVAVMLATLVLTELLTNTAAAALMMPVALSVGVDVGAPPQMLAVAVLIGASCSFLSPVGYQTNLMVFGLGGYRFGDFARVGAPLTVSTLVTAALIIPSAFG
ncbi:MAG: SLC13 family permease [Ilumatobacter sp.]|jgi:di/tricarboxylate transporter|uniref:SLC13 family permease n=1 Tax=Ilumatobacter sp. TaxID=1967498 RepID=UPI00391D8CE7